MCVRIFLCVYCRVRERVYSYVCAFVVVSMRAPRELVRVLLLIFLINT